MKLNLGCGFNQLEGYVNVDRETACSPDQVVDLEHVPWPFDDDSADEVLLFHTLEHLGETAGAYIALLKELYRICRPGAVVRIRVPHPRHDEFIIDPTHVRAILPEQFQLFSKQKNRDDLEEGYANSPLGLYHDIDFELEETEIVPDDLWLEKLKAGDISPDELAHLAMHQYNIIREVAITLRVVKDGKGAA